MPKRSFWLLLSVALPLTLLGFLAWPRPVEAQCGSSASSCKDCHEVKRQAPVNQKGEWHTGHAFGDFCEFCHGGNVKAKDAASAHKGMSREVVDVKASCLSCHPNDYAAKADKYAAALGRPLGSGGSTMGATASTTKPAASAPAATEPCGPAAPTGGETIDLAKIYEASLLPPPVNMGNGILLGLIGLVAVTFGGLGLHYERPIPRAGAAFRKLLASGMAAPVAEGRAEGSAAAVMAERPELARLVDQLANADQETLRALTHLLSDSENGPKVVKAIGNLDVAAMAKLSEGDRKALAALLDLVNELKA